jgi:hypothetical protein
MAHQMPLAAESEAPNARFWTRLNKADVPLYSVALVAVLAIVLTLPALVEVEINGAPVPMAFNAVVSIGVVGLYLAFAIPIFQRWRKGSAFKSGAWNLGRHYKWLCLIAVIEIGVTTVIAILPTSPGGVPWNPPLRVEVRQLHATGRGRNPDPAVVGLAVPPEADLHRAAGHGRSAARCDDGR